MSFVDESLLSRLVDKFGVDTEEKGPNKTRLWAKITKEYNSITGNSHGKARLSKKWQNIKHQRKLKRMKLYEQTTKVEGTVKDDQGNEMFVIAPATHAAVSYSNDFENLWNVMDYAFRDLFLYLIKKYDVDEVTNPRIKNELWKNINREFHELIGNIITIKHEKFTKKWQNWKQYNKSKQKPHPFLDGSINMDFDVIKEKIRKVKERVQVDPSFAAFLKRESDGDPLSKSDVVLNKVALSTNEGIAEKSGMSQSSSAMSNKQLEREVFMEALRCEQERFRVLIENGQLEKDKLQRETNWMELQLQIAQADLALKKQECQDKGIILH